MKHTSLEALAAEVIHILQRLRKEDVDNLVSAARRSDMVSDVAIRWLVGTAMRAGEFDELPLSLRAYTIDIINLRDVTALIDKRAPFSLLELSLSKPLGQRH